MSDMEDRLRSALSRRAAAVEPARGDIHGLEVRAAAARRSRQRRQLVLSAAAVVLAVAAVTGAVLRRDDEDRTDVSTEGEETTTSSTPTTSSTSTSTSTTATTIPMTDDGVAGWPGNTSRVFDDPQAAAQAFVTDMLGFDEPTLADSTSEGADAEFVFHPRPTASITTTVSVHDTGNVRGWVVSGVQGSAGTIDSHSFDGRSVTLSGSASAFEATVTILVLDVEGNVLAESFTMASGTAELGPYEATIDVDPGAGTPFWVMIAERDASAEGEFIWATTAALTG